MPNFNLDDLLEKATDFLDKASEDHLKKSEQLDQVIELINDNGLRAGVEALIAQGGILGATVLGRLSEIFGEDEEPTPEPEPTPAPETGERITLEEFLTRVLNGEGNGETGNAPRFGAGPFGGF